MKNTLKMRFAILAATACWAISAPLAQAQEAPNPMRGADVNTVDQAPIAINRQSFRMQSRILMKSISKKTSA
jgi:hypothetical protein